MRRIMVALGAALLAIALSGCGAIDRGAAFADQFQPFLDGRDDIEESSIHVWGGSLPFTGSADVTVTLVDDLSDDEIAQEVWEITAHEVDDQIWYGLQVRFAAQNADGQRTITAFSLEVPDAAPDDDDLRDDIADRVDDARAFAALGSGPSEVEASQTENTLTTHADALAVAAVACEDEDLVESLESLIVEGTLPPDPGDGTDVTSRVRLGGAGDCSWVPDATAVLQAILALGPVGTYSVSFEGYLEQPQLSVSLFPGTVIDPAVPQALATDLGVELVLS